MRRKHHDFVAGVRHFQVGRALPLSSRMGLVGHGLFNGFVEPSLDGATGFGLATSRCGPIFLLMSTCGRRRDAPFGVPELVSLLATRRISLAWSECILSRSPRMLGEACFIACVLRCGRIAADRTPGSKTS